MLVTTRSPNFDLGDAINLVASGFCCSKNSNCFLLHKTLGEAAVIVRDCRLAMEGMNRIDRLDYQRSVVKACVVSQSASSGYLSMEYRVKSTKDSISNEVCVTTFMRAYDISDYYIRQFRDVSCLHYVIFLHY
jgi:hypothetical protein